MENNVCLVGPQLHRYDYPEGCEQGEGLHVEGREDPGVVVSISGRLRSLVDCEEGEDVVVVDLLVLDGY